MPDLGDEAAHGGSVLQGATPAQLIEAEADQRLFLDLGPARRAGDLLNRNALARLRTGFPVAPAGRPLSCHDTLPCSSRLTRCLGVAGRAVAPAGHDVAHLLRPACRTPP